MIEYTEKVTVDITPERLARIFYEMDSEQQADFFAALHGEVSSRYESGETPMMYSLGEMQWLYMRNAIRKRGKEASDVYMAISAYAFDYWPTKDAGIYSNKLV